MKFIFSFLLLFIISCTFSDAKNIVVFDTTQGKIRLQMRADIAPKAVENFVTHVKNKYYNGIIFHRIIKKFMIQGGDPTGTGRGGKSIWGKPFKDEFKPNVVFDKAGILAMANAGPNTNGSQFFITTVPTPWLNGHHTIFGYVADKKSMQVLKALENVKTNRTRPIKTQKIIKAYIEK